MGKFEHGFGTQLGAFLLWRRVPSGSLMLAVWSHHIASHCIAWHYIALHCITLPYIASHCIALHYIALHFIALHYIALHNIALHCIALHFIALHCNALHCITLHCMALVFKISFRIQTGENKTKELGFHVGILWRFTSLKGFMSNFFWVSVGFHVGFDLGILSGFI